MNGRHQPRHSVHPITTVRSLWDERRGPAALLLRVLTCHLHVPRGQPAVMVRQAAWPRLEPLGLMKMMIGQGCPQ
jgi:hypothetical protein